MKNILIVLMLLVSSGRAPAQGAVTDAQVTELEQKIARLEARLRALENRKTHKVTAPFSVVDVAGRTRMRVGVSGTDSVLVLYNQDGSPTLGMRAQKEGAQVSLFALDGTQLATMGSSGIGAGITLAQADGSKYAEIDSDDGVMLRSGKSGKQMLQLWTDGQISSVDVYSATSGKSAAQLKTMSSGVGRFTLSDEGGNIMVEAGTSDTGVGVIRLGPGGHGPAQAMAGMGKAASSLIGTRNKK